MNFTLFGAGCQGVAANTRYPHRLVVDSKEALAAAVAQDHVCAAYRDSYRKEENFLWSDVVPMDVDNQDSEEESSWLTPEDVLELFPDCRMAVVASRNNGKSKRGERPRPRFHVFFPIGRLEEVEAYKALKLWLQERYPFFDREALGGARFLFGAEPDFVLWQEGSRNVTELLEEEAVAEVAAAEDSMEACEMVSAAELLLEAKAMPQGGVIPQGERNATLSRRAAGLVKRYGDTPEAKRCFLAEAELCRPPLEARELEGIWRSAQKFFHEKVATAPGYKPPEEFGHEGLQLLPRDFSDVAQAEVLVREYGQRLRYSTATDFIVYNGSFWEESRPKAQGLSQELTDRQLAEAGAEVTRLEALLAAAGLRDTAQLTGQRGQAALVGLTMQQWELVTAYRRAVAYRAYAIRRRESKQIGNALRECRPMLEISPEELDAHEFLLNTPGATYDLRQGTAGAQPHQGTDFLTLQTAVDPGQEGRELWEQALETFFQGDRELIGYVQRIAGLAAIGKVFVEALIIAYGGGRNGKSTFWNVLGKVLGSYSWSISAEALTRGYARNVRPELAEVKGKRLVIAAELEDGQRLSTTCVKQLCSTDRIAAEKKYKDPFSFEPTHTLVLYTNHLPRVSALDQGTWRRLIVIPFDAKIEGGSDVKNYAEYLFQQAGGAILSWIMEGARLVIEENFRLQMPERVLEAVAQYRGDNNWLESFLEECCVKDKDARERSGLLYETYRAYCLGCGEFAKGTKDFYGALEGAGYKRKRLKQGVFMQGLRLKTEFED